MFWHQMLCITTGATVTIVPPPAVALSVGKLIMIMPLRQRVTPSRVTRKRITICAPSRRRHGDSVA